MKEILEEKAEFTLLEENIVKIFVYDHVHLDEDDVKNIHRMEMKMVKNRPHSVLFVAGEFISISSEGRALSAADDKTTSRIAKAIVTSSFAHKLIVNFFMRFNKPKGQIRLFDCETEALAWLKKFN